MSNYPTRRQIARRRRAERATRRADRAAAKKFREDLAAWPSKMSTRQRAILLPGTTDPADVPTSPAVLDAMASDRGAVTVGTVVAVAVVLAAVTVGALFGRATADDPATVAGYPATCTAADGGYLCNDDTADDGLSWTRRADDRPAVVLDVACRGNVRCLVDDDGGVVMLDDDNDAGWYVDPSAVRGNVDTLDPAPSTIREDDPRWDCWTMGNRVCGPVRVVLNLDGSADVHDNPPQDQMGDTLRAVVGHGGVVYNVDPLDVPDPCDGPAGVGAVLVMADPHDIPSDPDPSTVRAAVISDDVDDAADPLDGPCTLAVATVTVD